MLSVFPVIEMSMSSFFMPGNSAQTVILSLSSYMSTDGAHCSKKSGAVVKSPVTEPNSRSISLRNRFNWLNGDHAPTSRRSRRASSRLGYINTPFFGFSSAPAASMPRRSKMFVEEDSLFSICSNVAEDEFTLHLWFKQNLPISRSRSAFDVPVCFQTRRVLKLHLRLSFRMVPSWLIISRVF